MASGEWELLGLIHEVLQVSLFIFLSYIASYSLIAWLGNA